MDWDLVSIKTKEKMVVCIAFYRAREENARQVSKSIHRESIVSARMMLGSHTRCAAPASLEAVRSIWRLHTMAEAQPLRWCGESKTNT